MKQYITTDPEIMSGHPCIVGTRIPIARVLFLISQGYSLKDVKEVYPQVSLKVLKGVFSELAQDIQTNGYVDSHQTETAA